MHEHNDESTDDFLQLVCIGEDDPPLMASALALSRLLQRGDTWAGARALLAELEVMCVQRCAAHATDAHDARAETIINVMQEYGFEGNTQDYQTISNSFIDRVLEKRRGLPITLSVIALHLAERSGADLRGVGFPGHFVVGAGLGEPTPTIFDIFNEGRRLSFGDLADLYRAATGRKMTAAAPVLREALRPVGSREILSRMLRNLQQHYAARGSHDRVVEVVGLLAEMHPEVEKLRDLEGRLYRRLESLN